MAGSAGVLLFCLLVASVQLKSLAEDLQRAELTTPPGQLDRSGTVPPSRQPLPQQPEPGPGPGPGKPEPGQPEPGQPEPGQPEPGQPEPGPGPGRRPVTGDPQRDDADAADGDEEGDRDRGDSPMSRDGGGTSSGVSSPEQGRPPPEATPTPIQANQKVALQEVEQPKVMNVHQISGDKIAEPTTSPAPVTQESVPDGAYAVFDHRGRVCILATLMMDLEVMYDTEHGKRKKVTISLPSNAMVTGSCARDGERPAIRFAWNNMIFSILFDETEFGNQWFVSDMKFNFTLNRETFPEARTADRRKLWMDVEKQHTIKLFASPVDKAYYCTSEQDMRLYNGDGVHSATIILWNVHLQPYVHNGQFGASVNCPGGKVGRRRINETVPIAVGSALASVVLVTIAGYAVWRHFKVKKFNYDTME